MNGQLSERPLVEILHEIEASQISGALRLMRERAKAIIYLERGKIMFATTNLRPHRLVESARRRGIINASQIGNIERTAGKPIIQMSDEGFAALLLAGELVNQEQLNALRLEQSIDSLRVMLLWTDGEWHFTKLAGVTDLMGDLPQLFIKPTPLLVEAARHLPDEFIAARLANDDELIAPAANSSLFIQHEEHSSWHLSTSEGFMMSRLDQPMSVGTLVMLSGLPDAHARQIIYTLMLGKAISREKSARDFADAPTSKTHFINPAKRQPAQVSFPKPSNPAALEKESTAVSNAKNKSDKSPDPQAELNELFRRAASETHYEVLGIASDVSNGDLKRTYHALVKRFHPDLFRREQDQAKRTRIEQSFARISQAYEALRDEKLRATYDLKLKAQEKRAGSTLPSSNLSAPGKTTHAHPAKNQIFNAPVALLPIDPHLSSEQQAEERFRQGMDALKNGNNLLAVTVFGEAVKLAPDNASYHALYGNSLTYDSRTHRQAEAELQKAISLDAKEMSYRIMLAEFYRQIGLRRRAIGELERALTLDSKHAGVRRLLDEIKQDKS